MSARKKASFAADALLLALVLSVPSFAATDLSSFTFTKSSDSSSSSLADSGSGSDWYGYFATLFGF